MAVTAEFIETTCRSCPHHNNMRSGVNRLVRLVAQKEIDAGGEVCGHCGCNLHRMAAAGKACPIGKSGENQGLWRKLRGRGKAVETKTS